MKLNLKKPVLELTKKPAVSPIKQQSDGSYARKSLATTKKEVLARKMV